MLDNILILEEPWVGWGRLLRWKKAYAGDPLMLVKHHSLFLLNLFFFFLVIQVEWLCKMYSLMIFAFVGIPKNRLSVCRFGCMDWKETGHSAFSSFNFSVHFLTRIDIMVSKHRTEIDAENVALANSATLQSSKKSYITSHVGRSVNFFYVAAYAR